MYRERVNSTKLPLVSIQFLTAWRLQEITPPDEGFFHKTPVREPSVRVIFSEAKAEGKIVSRTEAGVPKVISFPSPFSIHFSICYRRIEKHSN